LAQIGPFGVCRQTVSDCSRRFWDYDFEVAYCDLKMKRRRTAKLLRMPNSLGAPVFSVESRILFLRRQRVILDAVLAELYGVPVKRLNQQVTRNQKRFPSDFMFQLTATEHEALRLQIATSKKGRGGRRYLPHVFTEHGAIMAATVLNSARAVTMSVFVVRAFVRLREALATNHQVAAKIDKLERHLNTHDSVIMELIETVKSLMAPARARRRRIGFQLPALKAK
jgi:hypothetical protein